MEPFIYGVIMLVIGVVLFIAAFKLKKLYNTIRNLPTSKIRSVAMGLVELCGQVVPNSSKKINAPFSGKECVYSKWRISRYVKTKNGGHFRKIKEGVVSDYFYLNDGTGTVLVNPDSAEMSIPVSYSNQTRSPSKKMVQFLEDNKISGKTFFGTYHLLKFEEWTIFPKKTLFLIGTASDNPYVKDGSAKHNFEDIMICKGKKDNIYYITNSEERGLLVKLGLKIHFFQYGGIALILLGLWFIFSLLNMI